MKKIYGDTRMNTTPKSNNWSLEFIEKTSKDFNKLDAENYGRVT